MATRSAIGYRQQSGAVRAVYCHWDGYPEHQLPILREHYDTLDKVKALIRPGSMSQLRTRQLWDHSNVKTDDAGNWLRDDEGLAHYVNEREPQPLYHCERGETDCGPRVSQFPRNLWFHSYDCEHLYIFEPSTNEWPHQAENDPL